MSSVVAVQHRQDVSIRGGLLVQYRTVDVETARIFYREAGAEDALLLLQLGIPTATTCSEYRIPRLADLFRLVAPELPCFGWLDIPPEIVFNILSTTLLRSSIDSLRSRFVGYGGTLRPMVRQSGSGSP